MSKPLCVHSTFHCSPDIDCALMEVLTSVVWLITVNIIVKINLSLRWKKRFLTEKQISLINETYQIETKKKPEWNGQPSSLVVRFSTLMIDFVSDSMFSSFITKLRIRGKTSIMNDPARDYLQAIRRKKFENDANKVIRLIDLEMFCLLWFFHSPFVVAVKPKRNLDEVMEK